MRLLRFRASTALLNDMKNHVALTTLALIALGLTACGGDAESDTAPPTTPPATESETEPTAASTTEPTSTMAAPETTEITEITETTGTTESPSSTAAPKSSTEVISTELEMLSVLGISLGAGSGEYDVLVDRLPDGFERFKVSTAGADGYCNARILATQTVPRGVVVTVYPECAGSTFGVAWVHVDGRRSDIAYRDCSAGITYETSC